MKNSAPRTSVSAITIGTDTDPSPHAAIAKPSLKANTRARSSVDVTRWSSVWPDTSSRLRETPVAAATTNARTVEIASPRAMNAPAASSDAASITGTRRARPTSANDVMAPITAPAPWAAVR